MAADQLDDGGNQEQQGHQDHVAPETAARLEQGAVDDHGRRGTQARASQGAMRWTKEFRRVPT